MQSRDSTVHPTRRACVEASAEQRRGRAGRVRAGTCCRLWPEGAEMSPETTPEMLRAPLDDIVLDCCLLGIASPIAFLADCPTPPRAAAVTLAVDNLVSLQAMEKLRPAALSSVARGGRSMPPSSEQGYGEIGLGSWGGSPNAIALRLTPLGTHIAHLPLDARVAKMLLLAALCECLSPILSVAAALSANASSQTVFGAVPRDKQEKASAAQREAFGALRSDLLAVAAAYEGWAKARADGGARGERAYCSGLFLNGRALRDIESERKELLRHLEAIGFMPPKQQREVASPALPSPPSTASSHASSLSRVPCSAHSGNETLLRGIICAAFYPNVAVATRTTASSGQSYEKLTLAGGDVQAWMHPSSINARPGKAESGLYVYTEKLDSSRLFLRESTRVPPAALLLFGATPSELDVERVKQSGRVDLAGGSVRVRVSPQTCLLFKLLRKALDGLLLSKARDPGSSPERDPAGRLVIDVTRRVIGQY